MRLMAGVYVAVLLALLVGSVFGYWPTPWLQWLLPVLVFGVAAGMGRAHRFAKTTAQCSTPTQHP